MRITFKADLYLPHTETLTDDEVRSYVKEALKVGWRHQEFDIQLQDIDAVEEGREEDGQG